MVNRSAATIYIVDDDEMVRDSLKAVLEAHQFSVVEFASAPSFLDGAGSAPAARVLPACLLVDIHMPGMTGLELLRALRERGRSLPTILITGRNEESARAEARALGAVALLDKPVAHPALFAAIEQALGTAPS
jgi:FixJ family two-component response regulator